MTTNANIQIKTGDYLVNYLNSASRILILSKGQTNLNINNVEKNYDICIGVKQSILLLKKKDILVMNDLEGLFGLEQCISQIKNIIMPIRTHIGSKPHNNGYNIVKKYLKVHNFNGNIIYYRFRPQEKKDLFLINKTGSGEIIHNFLNKCPNRNKIIIDHIGLYTSFKDNYIITNNIINATIIKPYQNYYNRWIVKIYGNKKKTNIRFLLNNNRGVNIKDVLHESRNKLKGAFPNLNINFLKDIQMNKKYICFIPARYSSSRLPGKPLLKINGKTIIRHVYEQVEKCKNIHKIIILTDDNRIQEEVHSFNGECHITDDCLNGTSRIVNFINDTKMDCDLVINVQGDEPFINPENIDACIENFVKNTDKNPDMKCSTLHFKHSSEEEVRKRSNGKLVLDKNNNIMYGSRNIIPGMKKTDYDEKTIYHGHIGIFVYDKEYLLNEYLNRNTPYQLAEDIEWLKILEDGYKINSVLVDKNSHERGVDTQEDYNYLKEKYENK